MDMSQYKALFVSEAIEHLQVVNHKLVELERNPQSDEALEQIFRSAHTIKGMAATMGYADLAQLAHALEDVLDRVRQGERAVTPHLMERLFSGVDGLSALVSSVAADQPSDLDVQTLIERIHQAATPPQIMPSDGPLPPGGAVQPSGALLVRVQLADDCQMKSLRTYMVLERLRELGEIAATEPEAEILAGADIDSFDVFLRSGMPSEHIKTAIENISEVEAVSVSSHEPVESAPIAPAAAEQSAMPETAASPPASSGMIRVNVQHLDLLLNLVSELVISRGQLVEAIRALEVFARQNDGAEESLLALNEALDHHDRTLGHLHESVLQVRMVPVSQIFDRFPRMVRDLLHELGKEAEFEIEGREVEMDRAALEALSDPLMHLLRNAIDHGLEPPWERQRAGKPARGVLRLVARRERGQAIIEVQDDGRGMDVDRIVDAAITRGLVARERAHELNRDQILMFICQPGFSLADEVTAVSGRGVGMDVVRRQVEALRGALEIHTLPGRGSTFRLSLPLSLALTQALIVDLMGERYAVPLHYIERTVEVDYERVQQLHRWELLQLDDEILPLFRLAHLLGLPASNGAQERQALVVRRGEQKMGLLVDDLLDKQTIVVKPLPESLAGLPGLSGTTVIGNGQVMLILDLPSLIQRLV
ncbi:MAG: chemotaxis protein CheA [Chloroflexota bacterium]